MLSLIDKGLGLLGLLPLAALAMRRSSYVCRSDRRKSARLLEALDALRCPVLISDAHHNVCFLNKALRDKVGDRIGEKCFRVWLKKETPCQDCRAGEIISGERDLASYLIEDMGGRIYDCSASLFVMPDGCMTVLEIFDDVTEKKRAERVIQEYTSSLRSMVAEKSAQLKKSEELHRILLERANDAILTISPSDGRILRANRMAEVMTGYRMDELLSLQASSLYGPGVFERMALDLSGSRSGSGTICRAEILKKGGGSVPVDISASRIVFNGREIILTICRDLSQRLMIEKRMRQLASVIENIAVSVILTDLDQRIIYVNSATQKMLGYRQEEMLGRRSPEFFEGIPGNPPRLAELIEREANEGSWEGEIFNRTKDGRIFPVSLRMCVIKNETGDTIGYAGISEDITKRKEMEDELIQKEKLSALGELISGIAHELNNPLTGVLGYAEIILNSQCPEEVRGDAERLYREALRCHYLVKNLLTFGRRPSPQRDFFDINGVINNALNVKAHHLEADHIELACSLQRDIPMAFIDPHQIQQVLINILNNAHHAVQDKRGNRRITISSALRGDSVEIAVGNNGPSIPAGIMEKIFSPFYSTKRFGHGTGLGLSIAQSIVKDHGGEIRVESREGRDTVFTVILPLTPRR